MKKIIFIVLILSGANLSSQNINDLIQGNNSKQITVQLNEMTDDQSKYTGISKIGPFKPKGYRY